MKFQAIRYKSNGMRPLKIHFSDFAELMTRPIIEALKDTYDLQLDSQAPDVLFYSDGKGKPFARYPNCKKIYLAYENKCPDYSECDYSMSYLNLGTDRNLRVPYYVFETDMRLLVKQPGEAEKVAQQNRKFCAFLVSNGNVKRSPERAELFIKLSKYKQVDSGGKFLNNVGGPVKDTNVFYSQHKFAITCENDTFREYTSEKIANAMANRCIPIYWGNADVALEFNPKSFVNVHDYPSIDAAIERVIEIDQNDALYQQYLREPYFYNNTPNMYCDLARMKTFLINAIEAPVNPRKWFDVRAVVFNRGKKMLPYPRRWWRALIGKPLFSKKDLQAYLNSLS